MSERATLNESGGKKQLRRGPSSLSRNEQSVFSPSPPPSVVVVCVALAAHRNGAAFYPSLAYPPAAVDTRSDIYLKSAKFEVSPDTDFCNLTNRTGHPSPHPQ